MLDLQTGASIGAAAGVIQGGLEADGAGASFIASGAMTVGGGIAQVLAANGGLIEASSLVLGSATGLQSVLAVDPAGRIEVGTAGTGATGTLTIDAGSTLTDSAASAAIEGPVTDNGLLLDGTGSGRAFLSLTGNLAGSGSLALGSSAQASVEGTIANLSAIAAGASSSLTVYGDMTGVGTLTTGTLSTVTVEAR